MRSSNSSYIKLWPDARHNPDTTRHQEASSDWLKEQAASRPAKEGARVTGLSVVAFQNIRAGKNKISFDALMEWCRNDRAFAISLAMQMGVLPGDAEQQAAMMREMTGRRE